MVQEARVQIEVGGTIKLGVEPSNLVGERLTPVDRATQHVAPEPCGLNIRPGSATERDRHTVLVDENRPGTQPVRVSDLTIDRLESATSETIIIRERGD